MMRLKYWKFKNRIKLYVSRRRELLHTPKPERPIKKLLWYKMDEASNQMAIDLGRQLYGYGYKEFDGLGSIVDNDTNVSTYDKMYKTNLDGDIIEDVTDKFS